ncbi:hypothetical protein JXM67_02380 [candidate division WOR-3 bacterium]|nr:hypothetical protein [candidate division WOR-3 bacterium]
MFRSVYSVISVVYDFPGSGYSDQTRAVGAPIQEIMNLRRVRFDSQVYLNGAIRDTRSIRQGAQRRQ